MDAVNLIQSLGFPVSVVIGLSFAMWSALKWGANNIFKPLADNHIAMISDLRAVCKENADNIKKITECLDRLVSERAVDYAASQKR